MKKIAKLFLALGMLSTVMLTTGCFGKFSLTKEVYSFHNSIAGNDTKGKLIKSLLLIVGGEVVYGFSIFVDVVALNLIEFWTGSNPLAMAEGQKETQVVMRDGIKYEITATRNNFEVKQLTGENKGKVQSVTFNEKELAWYNTSNGASQKMIQYSVEKGQIVSAVCYGQNGQSVVINQQQLDQMFNTVALK